MGRLQPYMASDVYDLDLVMIINGDIAELGRTGYVVGSLNGLIRVEFLDDILDDINYNPNLYKPSQLMSIEPNIFSLGGNNGD